MRAAVITDEISQDLDHALDVLCEYGIDAAELRAMWKVNIADVTDEQAERAAAALRSRGIACVGLATPLYKCALDPAGRDDAGAMHLARERGLAEQRQALERCLYLARLFGAPRLRIFSFWKAGDLTPPVVSRIAAALGEGATVAGEAGVTLGLENEPSCFAGTGAQAAEIVRQAASPHLRLCWDAGNALYAGGRPFPDDYEAARPYLAHVHVKGVARDPEGKLQPCPFGTGLIDYGSLLDALRRDGYDGCVSLETEYVPPSGDKEEGTRACLPALLEALAR